MNSILVQRPILSLKKVFWCRPSYRTWNSRMIYLFKLFNFLQVVVIEYVVFLSHCGLMSTSTIPPTIRVKSSICVVGRTDGGVGRGPSQVRVFFFFLLFLRSLSLSLFFFFFSFSFLFFLFCLFASVYFLSALARFWRSLDVSFLHFTTKQELVWFNVFVVVGDMMQCSTRYFGFVAVRSDSRRTCDRSL